MLGFMDLGWPRVCRRSTSVLFNYLANVAAELVRPSGLLLTFFLDLLHLASLCTMIPLEKILDTRFGFCHYY